jgi:WD40 repeat protein
VLAVAGGTPGVSGAIGLIDWQTRAWVHRFTNFTDLATSVAFDAKGSRLVAAGADQIARILLVGADAVSWTEAHELRGHAGPVLAAGFSLGDRTIITASADRSLKVWSAEDGRLLRTFSQHTEPIHALAFRPRSANTDAAVPVVCATGSDDRTVRVWQPERGRMVRIVRHHAGSIFAVVFSRDGSALFSAGKEGVIRRIDAESDVVLEQWAAHADSIFALALSLDGTTLASGDASGTVKLWNVETVPARPR